ncbi:hypothetical protein ACH4F6_07720 [Streptomyces sp. NPDC017936]|uniref:hypothetical protein n=1 Tax=Streptomyces sp. NPDC017936 TaxID=3365016 RepID=UPI003795F257
MKSLKAAAVVAGSIVIAGAAAPAFAAPADLTPTRLDGAVDTLARDGHPLEVMPLQQQSRALDTENEGSLLNTLNEATKTLNDSRAPLLGGLPLKG